MDNEIPLVDNNQISGQEPISPSPDIPAASSKFGFQKKQIVIVVAVAVIVILLISIMLLILRLNPKSTSKNPVQSQKTANQNQQQPTNSPKLEFNSYTLSDYAESQSQPQIVSSYTLKNSF